MNATGIVRRIDDFGKIVIPKEIRVKLFGKANVEGQPMEFFLDKEGVIVIKPYKATNKWEPIVNSHGELTEFICSCGCSNQGASNFCPDCGTKMDNSDIEKRIQEAIKKELRPIL